MLDIHQALQAAAKEGRCAICGKPLHPETHTKEESAAWVRTLRAVGAGDGNTYVVPDQPVRVEPD